MMDQVIVRFRPSRGVPALPSESLNMALVSLAESDELQPLLRGATEEGKALAIDVFRNREGCPVFINFSKETLE